MFLVFLLLLAGCPLDMGEDVIRPREGFGDDRISGIILITDYNLQTYVPIPVAGENPVWAIRSRADVEVDVTWYRETTPNTDTWDPMTVGDSFESGIKYGADITLRAMKGFRFTSARNFRYELPTVVEVQPGDNQGASERTLTRVSYKKAASAAPVDYFDLTYRVPAPVAGSTPVSTITGAGQYTALVTWTKADDSPMEPGDFMSQTAYKAKLRLTAASGYAFDPPADMRFFHLGSDPVTDGTSASTSLAFKELTPAKKVGEVTIIFPATSVLKAVTVTDLDLTSKLPNPIKGSIPELYISSPQYMGTITWSPADGNFQAGTIYTAKLALIALSGHTFTGIAADAFLHRGADKRVTPNPTNAADSGTVTIVFPATTTTKAVSVTDLDLSNKVPKPVTGGTPALVLAASQYTGTISWNPPDSIFQVSTTYTATITLAAAPGYTFTGVGANTFIHSGKDGSAASSLVNAADSGTVMILFPATTTTTAVPVTDLDLTNMIAAPVRGSTPVLYLSGPQYTGVVNWTSGPSSTTPLADIFDGDTAYTATVTLTAVSGYTFTGVGADTFIHTGKDGALTPNPSNPADSGKVTIVFPATAEVSALKITDIDLSSKIPRPVTGGTPTLYLSTLQYAGTVSWLPAHGIFQANIAYTATVTLTAASGYSFTGVGANAFIHTGRDGALTPNPSNPAGKGKITIKFPMTTAGSVNKVTDLDLTRKIPKPVTGGTPTLYFSTPQYTGTVSWTSGPSKTALTGLFQDSSVYTAEVTLTAASGYSFNGVGADAFTHTGKDGSVTPNPSNPADSGKITIKFPVTTGGNLSTVTDLDMSKWIPAPEVGASAVRSFVSPEYIGSVKWSPATGIFKNSTIYTAEITLSAIQGYSFEGSQSFVHPGVDPGGISSGADPGHPGDKRWHIVTIKFPVTDPVVISDYDLKNYLSLPVKGEKPQVLITHEGIDQTATTVKWTCYPPDSAISTDPDYVFISDQEYQAEITLQVATGYIFDGTRPFDYPNETDANVLDSPSKKDTKKRTFTVIYTNLLEVEGFAAPKGRSLIDKLVSSRQQAGLYVEIKPGTETVAFGTDSLLQEGLVLRQNSTSPRTVTIDGNHREVTLGGTVTNGRPLITIESPITLILRDITLRGAPGNTAPLIKIYRGATLILEKGALIVGNTNMGRNNDDAGGILINGGILELRGGTVSGNSAGSPNMAGGISMDGAGGGTILIQSGTISGNSASGSSSGGGIRVRSGKLIMEGGTITGNTGGGVLLLEWSDFLMTDGTITGNTGGGGNILVSNYNAKSVISGGTIDILRVAETRIVEIRGDTGTTGSPSIRQRTPPALSINRVELLATPSAVNHAQITLNGILPANLIIDVVSRDTQSNQAFDRRTVYGQLGNRALLLGNTNTNNSGNYLRFTYAGNSGVFGSDGKIVP
ncbi:hypothetical protein LQZ21_07805 [Treponema sp. TIM-1]|uniref:hypothetical protein n=1 Tax=Treponema sp. TIM-1 TaxID=2898417 RepID=UPI00397EAE2E